MHVNVWLFLIQYNVKSIQIINTPVYVIYKISKTMENTTKNRYLHLLLLNFDANQAISD